MLPTSACAQHALAPYVERRIRFPGRRPRPGSLPCPLPGEPWDGGRRSPPLRPAPRPWTTTPPPRSAPRRARLVGAVVGGREESLDFLGRLGEGFPAAGGAGQQRLCVSLWWRRWLGWAPDVDVVEPTKTTLPPRRLLISTTVSCMEARRPHAGHMRGRVWQGGPGHPVHGPHSAGKAQGGRRVRSKAGGLAQHETAHSKIAKQFPSRWLPAPQAGHSRALAPPSAARCSVRYPLRTAHLQRGPTPSQPTPPSRSPCHALDL